MRRLHAGIVCVLVVLMMAMTLPASTQTSPQSVCLITDVGILNDGGFNQSAYDGMLRAVEEYGLEDTFIETQAPSDYELNINTCLDTGFDIIITVGFALGDATYVAAETNPDKFFIGIDQDFLGTEPLPNLVGLQFREDQGGFLAGAMAALMTETGVVGGVYGPDIAPVVKFRNGFEQGVRYINPEITVLGNYSDSFETPTEGGEVALTMIGDNADVIFGAGGRHGTGGIRRAAAEGAWVIGVDLDQYFTDFGGGTVPGAERIITSVIKGVDQGVYDMIVGAVEGTGFPDNSTYVMAIANNGIDFTSSHDAAVPEEVIDRVQRTLEDLGEGRIVTGVDPVSGELLPTLVQVAESAGDFSTLLAAAESVNLLETLAEQSPFTLFAPTDQAFAETLAEMGITLDQILADEGLLSNILLYHLFERAVTADQVVALDGEMIEMLNGGMVTITVTEDGVILNDDVNVIQTDILARNGVIHVIDAVLIPE